MDRDGRFAGWMGEGDLVNGRVCLGWLVVVLIIRQRVDILMIKIELMVGCLIDVDTERNVKVYS